MIPSFKEYFYQVFLENYDEQIPTSPGTYVLYRGSHDGNQNPSVGIYANGIHYTTDPSTAYEFGEDVRQFLVTIKKPFIVKSKYELQKNPTQATRQLLKLGYDSVVLLHKKYQEYVEDGEDRVSEYIEYEIIKLVDIDD